MATDYQLRCANCGWCPSSKPPHLAELDRKYGRDESLCGACGDRAVQRIALPTRQPPKHPIIFRLGMTIFALGVISGFIFVGIVGSDSAEFQRYFGYFIAAYAVGVILTLAGK